MFGFLLKYIRFICILIILFVFRPAKIIAGEAEFAEMSARGDCFAGSGPAYKIRGEYENFEGQDAPELRAPILEISRNLNKFPPKCIRFYFTGNWYNMIYLK